jgi:hypothetical protein
MARPGRQARSVALIGLLVSLLVAACASPPGTPRPAAVGSPGGLTTAAAASPGAPTAGNGASPAGSPSPSASDPGFTGGSAAATVTLPTGALEYAGGSCEHGIGDAWLAVNIGQPDGAEYFGLIAGRSPYSPTDVQTATGGGTLKGDAVVVTYRHAGTVFVLDHDSATVTVAEDVSSGTFAGHLADGTIVSGSFSC